VLHIRAIGALVTNERERGEVVLEDKSENEQIKLINQLDEEDKSTILKIIDTMLTKKKFKDFFNKNIAAL
jgi:hypothetical protein